MPISTRRRSSGCGWARSGFARTGSPSWSRRLAAGRLSFVVGAAAALAELADTVGPADVVFLCVPTPMGVGGVADLSAVEAVVEEIRSALAPGAVMVNKSTVPVGTAVRTAELLARPDVRPAPR